MILLIFPGHTPLAFALEIPLFSSGHLLSRWPLAFGLSTPRAISPHQSDHVWAEPPGIYKDGPVFLGLCNVGAIVNDLGSIYT
jgi:hypothetical protein